MLAFPVALEASNGNLARDNDRRRANDTPSSDQSRAPKTAPKVKLAGAETLRNGARTAARRAIARLRAEFASATVVEEGREVEARRRRDNVSISRRNNDSRGH